MSLLMLFLTDKLSLKFHLQFFVCALIAIRLAIKLDVVIAISLIVLELLIWITLWHSRKKKLSGPNKFSAKVYARKVLAVLAMIIGCSLVLIINKTSGQEKSLLVTPTIENGFGILFVFFMLMFFSDQIGERK